MAFVTPVVEDWLEQQIAQWVDHEGSIRQIAPWANALQRIYISLPQHEDVLFADDVEMFNLILLQDQLAAN